MTAPNTQAPQAPQQATDAAPGLTPSHTWAYVALTTLGTIVSAFAPKIQAYASHHPTGAIVAGGLAGIIGAFLPGATQQR